MKIPFSPPDIGEEEITEVVDALRSGWITTGPKTKEFERQIAAYCGTNRAVCLNSATAGLELVLRILGVGPGDEVITSAYTYTASASVIQHVGAKIVLCDTQKDSYEMDYTKLEQLITEKTKAIIPVDIAGKICDYESLYEIINRNTKFQANNDIQSLFNRIIIVTDAAHSFGAMKDGKKSGNFGDFTSFSFHAVKNLTTAEGGAVVWKDRDGLDNELLYKQFMLWSLHGQSKDALSKTKLGAWEYDIVMCGQKCNMTDIMAGIGLAQLRRYETLLQKRYDILKLYYDGLKNSPIKLIEHDGVNFRSSRHLLLTRVDGVDEIKRNEIINKMAEKGIATNVHYKPLPMHTAYKNLGFDIKDYPNAYNQYKNEITLPLHTLLTDEMVEFIVKNYKKFI